MKMNEVFELPVNSRDIYITSDLMELVEQPKDEVFIHAAHAINNVDTLADALEFLLNLPRGASGRIIIEKSEETLALAALKAYRGAK